MKNIFIALSGIFLSLLTWYLFADVLVVSSPMLLPPVTKVFLKLYLLFSTGTLVTDLVATLYRWSIGFFLGPFTGVSLGLLIGSSKTIYSIVEIPLEFLRSLPVTAIFPLFLLVFGIGDESKIAMAFLPTCLLVLVNTAYGVLYASPERRRMAKSFGATPLQIFSRITIFEAIPQIFIGLRLAVSLSLVVTVVSEMFIGTDFGLGQRVYDSYLTSAVTTLYAVLIVLGVLGYLSNKVLLFIEKRYIFWAGR